MLSYDIVPGIDIEPCIKIGYKFGNVMKRQPQQRRIYGKILGISCKKCNFKVV